jgi:hypothetical protein
MKIFTIDDIRSWDLYNDPTIYLPKKWSGTVIDILKHPKIPLHEKLSIVCREELIDAKTLRLFAVWCARQIHSLFPEECLKRALDVVEKFARGQASREELVTVRNALMDESQAMLGLVRNAVRDSSMDSYKEMLLGVDRSIALATALSAVHDVARNAALETAYVTAYNLASIAMKVAARKVKFEVAWDITRKFALNSARYAQCGKLLEMVEEAA